MRKSILHRRKRLRIKRDFELQLTSMMDMLIIILVFLLRSYTSTSVNFSSSDKITLPTSLTEEAPIDAVHLIIEPTGIIFDNQRVVEFIATPGVELNAENATYQVDSKITADGGRRILPLYDALIKVKENAELMMSKAVWIKKGDPAAGTVDQQVEKPKFHGTITIQADKRVRYDVIRKIMYTAGAAEFKVFKLVTVKKDAAG